MVHDVIIVGGSFAGHAAALQLARARRRILLIDAGRPRNRFAAASHGFLGQDGRAPAAIMREAMRQLSAYPTVDFVDGEATHATIDPEGFRLRLSDGGEAVGRRLILAIGIADTLPEVPGLAERWGVSVLHCPYCHGYEVADQPLGVLANHPMASHQAALIRDWGPTTLFTQGRFEPDAESLAFLEKRGVAIERSPVVGLVGPAPAIHTVRLADGRTVPIHALFVGPATSMTSPLAEQLGCAFDDGMLGPVIRVDDLKATTVQGVFAAGDATRSMHNATFAAADGVMAGVAAHRSLIWDYAAA